MSISTLSLRARLLSGAVCLSVLGLMPAHAFAETPASPDKTTVSEVIVVGGSNRPITVQPRGLSVSLGAEDFARINAVNVEDLMKYAPDFAVRKRYIGDSNAILGIRGTNYMQTARALVLVDGFVVSNFLGANYSYPPKWGVIAPGEVEQFDIVYGPYSSRYSGHSMGGIVSVSTRMPKETGAFATLQVMSQPYKQYGTDQTFNGYTAEIGGTYRPKDSPLAIRASYRRLENEGQPMMWGQGTPSTGTAPVVSGASNDANLVVKAPVTSAQSPDQNTQDQMRLRLDYQLDQNWLISGLAFGWLTNSDQTKPQTYLKDANGNPIYEGKVNIDGKTYALSPSNVKMQILERSEVLLGLKLDGKIGALTSRTNLSWYDVAKAKTRASTGYATGLNNGAGTLTEGGKIGWTAFDQLFTQKLAGQKLAFGLTANQYETDQTIYNSLNWRAGDQAQKTSRTFGKTKEYGVFVEDEIKLFTDHALTLGLRYDNWQAFDGGIGKAVGTAFVTQTYASRRDDALSPSFSYKMPLGEWTAQLSLAQATRFPTVGELYQGALDSNGNFNPNSFDPNLKPEQSNDANLMLRRNFDGVRVTGSIFYQEAKNAIYSQTGFNQNGVITTSFKNIDKVKQAGIEVILEAVDVMVKGLDLSANATFMDSEIEKNVSAPASVGQPFPLIPKWRVNGILAYKVNDRLKVNLGARYASRPNSDLFGLQRGKTYGYTSEFFILDTRISYRLTPQAEVSFGIDNLNNDKAWVYHPMPQRTYVLELKWKS